MTIIPKDVQVGLDLIGDLTTQTLTEHCFKIILKQSKTSQATTTANLLTMYACELESQQLENKREITTRNA